MLYVSLRWRFNGSNNGDISMSVREAVAEVRISKDTAGAAFKELQEKGFVRCNQPGSFNWKAGLASTWILTEERYRNDLATKEFLNWVPQKKRRS